MRWVMAMMWAGMLAAVRGELAWESQSMVLELGFGRREATGAFRVENRGKEAVKIKGVRTTCGCTQAPWVDRVIGPGEKAVLAVAFRPGSKTGVQREWIIVETEPAAAKEIVLQLEARVPDWLRVRPSALSWRTGDREPKELTLEVTGPEAIRVTGVEAEPAHWTAGLVEEKAGWFYRVRVVPVEGAPVGPGLLKLQLDQPKDAPHRVEAALMIWQP